MPPQGKVAGRGGCRKNSNYNCFLCKGRSPVETLLFQVLTSG